MGSPMISLRWESTSAGSLAGHLGILMVETRSIIKAPEERTWTIG